MSMIKDFFYAFLVLFLLLSTGCKAPVGHPFFQESDTATLREYKTFDEYKAAIKQHLKANRYFLTDNKEDELQANLPFEVKPSQPVSPSKGVLLIHGLGDSPFSFTDIANDLAKRGFLVRTVLLSGHGTRPGDMLSVDSKDWDSLVSKHTRLLKNVVNDVYLGGFSTGANLAYLEAVKDPDIKGLMLFSPGFQSNSSLVFLAKFVAPFKQWLYQVNPDTQTNYARYRAVPTQGVVAYQETSKKVMRTLKKNRFDRPAFIVLSEHDSVINTLRIKKLFHRQFTNKNSRLMWFGAEKPEQTERIEFINSNDDSLRVSNMSHMGVLFSVDNPYYGINGTQRICKNRSGETTDKDEAYCKEGQPVWYGAWGTYKEGLVHARLTFNPFFDKMMNSLSAVFSSKSTIAK